MKFYISRPIVSFFNDTDVTTPKILASNHPNSFFDAIFVALHYPKPIYFLARGDAFKNPFVAAILTKLKMLPIYRLSEGVENLNKNEDTFEQCIALLKAKQSILIFSEGLCVNNWQLRPLKKGTARIALLCKKANLSDVTIQPLNINYDSFDKFPKRLSINYNLSFDFNEIDSEQEAKFYQTFNTKLTAGIADKMLNKSQLSQLDPQKNNTAIRKALLAIPAFIGYITQRWFFDIVRNFVRKKTKNTVFFDSIFFGVLMFSYPFFVLFSTLLLCITTQSYWALLASLLLPATAFCYREWKTA